MINIMNRTSIPIIDSRFPYAYPDSLQVNLMNNSLTIVSSDEHTQADGWKISRAMRVKIDLEM